LYVCMLLPLNYDTTIITSLQTYSAQFTSQLLDLLGLGHLMNGTVIIVPNVGEYGVQEACSGVVSFFTLLAVTSVFVVWARRIATPNPVVATFLVLVGLALCIFEYSTTGLGYLSVLGISLVLMGLFGFRAGVILMSAVFWALFINTVRIMTIPLADYHLEVDLSHGVAHDILGYTVLLFGILLVLSTDQFLLFLFGPVEVTGDESGQFSKPITKFWNGFLAGGDRKKKRRRARKPVSKMGRAMIWTVALIMIGCGLFQLVDVQRSLAQPQYRLRFFDTDVTVDFEQDDIPEFVGGTWKRVTYETEDRERGSDFGTRSDIWQFQAPRCRPTASLDQTFPGWHELTKCYRGIGWKLIDRTRYIPETKEGELPWAYIEATFEKETGEKGYLLFSHFDAEGEPVEAPARWGSINSFFIRARNRLSRRVRANLFDGETYQTQVFLQSYNGFDEEVKEEAKNRYLEIREIMRQRFKDKRAAESEA
jgi:exosortase/archaeosortase family protein